MKPSSTVDAKVCDKAFIVLCAEQAVYCTTAGADVDDLMLKGLPSERLPVPAGSREHTHVAHSGLSMPTEQLNPNVANPCTHCRQAMLMGTEMSNNFGNIWQLSVVKNLLVQGCKPCTIAH